MKQHFSYMKRALALAACANPAPNPKVGAVLVSKGSILAEGFHKQYGGPHAEIDLFHSLPKDFDYSNTTLYVSLEPCSHQGKTPSCAAKIIELKIPKVVVACVDSNPLVSGRGIAMMRDAGIEVIVGVFRDEAQKLNEAFFKWVQQGMPFICMKAAMSLDGKIATASGQSRWISCSASRQDVHRLRNEYTAIMVGINTVLKDDPILTCRMPGGRNPIRIIVDSTLKTPLSAAVVQTAKDTQTIIATVNQDKKHHRKYEEYGVDIIVCAHAQGHVCLRDMCKRLAEKNVESILLEGGSQLFYSALSAQIVDKARIYIAPFLLGGKQAPSLLQGEGVLRIEDAFQLNDIFVERINQDIVIEGMIVHKEGLCLQG